MHSFCHASYKINGLKSERPKKNNNNHLHGKCTFCLLLSSPLSKEDSPDICRTDKLKICCKLEAERKNREKYCLICIYMTLSFPTAPSTAQTVKIYIISIHSRFTRLFLSGTDRNKHKISSTIEHAQLEWVEKCKGGLHSNCMKGFIKGI